MATINAVERRPAAAKRGSVDKPAAPPTPSRRRKLLAGIAYLLFLLVVVEAALQGFYYINAGDFLFARVGRPIYAAHEHAGFWNKPLLSMPHSTNEFQTTIYTNSQGFRVSDAREEFSVAKPPEIYRVLLLGPSFAFGWGVDQEETFAALLEDTLNEGGFAGGRRVEVINAGVPSLPTASQLKWFQHVGREYRPDLVIQFIYGSMIGPREPTDRFDVTEEGYLVEKDAGFCKQLQARMKNSALVFYAWMAYSRFKQSSGTSLPGDEIQGAGRTMQVEGTFDPADSRVVDSLRYYQELQDSVHEAGSQLLVVHFPLSYAVHREDEGRWKHLGVHDVDQQLVYNRQFCEEIDRRGIRCLNLTDDLIEAARSGQRQYYWLDIHWTPAGNLVATQAVARALFDGDRTTR